MMRLLIVENDIIVTKIWKRFFSRDFEVDTAFQAEEAIELIKQNEPDIIFLDLRLNGPHVTGMTVYDFVRNELKSKAAIFFITGLEDNVDTYKKALVATTKDKSEGLKTLLIKKPISIKELRGLIKGINVIEPNSS